MAVLALILTPGTQIGHDLFGSSGNNFLTLHSLITSPKFSFRHVKPDLVRKVTVKG